MVSNNTCVQTCVQTCTLRHRCAVQVGAQKSGGRATHVPRAVKPYPPRGVGGRVIIHLIHIPFALCRGVHSHCTAPYTRRVHTSHLSVPPQRRAHMLTQLSQKPGTHKLWLAVALAVADPTLYFRCKPQRAASSCSRPRCSAKARRASQASRSTDGPAMDRRRFTKLSASSFSFSF